MRTEKFLSPSETPQEYCISSNLVTMNRSITFLLLLLLLLCNTLLALTKAQAPVSPITTSCRCPQISKSIPNLKAFEKLDVILPSTLCPRPEIVGTVKDTKEQVCLNPDTPTMKVVLKAIRRTRS
ncbi:C-X-C motif chemokine 10-like [Petaurus breviceps papuanus]|uniref:C-X-C motif chemokine 10-like n=1 Tax=Petaurus breviceps papuanus TaxID=3040969 RepID=UPI0036D9596E